MNEKQQRLYDLLSEVQEQLADNTCDGNPAGVVDILASLRFLSFEATKTPEGFTGEKPGYERTEKSDEYWFDAVRDFWAETGLGTDCVEVRWIVNWFDQRRKK